MSPVDSRWLACSRSVEPFSNLQFKWGCMNVMHDYIYSYSMCVNLYTTWHIAVYYSAQGHHNTTYYQNNPYHTYMYYRFVLHRYVLQICITQICITDLYYTDMCYRFVLHRYVLSNVLYCSSCSTLPKKECVGN